MWLTKVHTSQEAPTSTSGSSSQIDSKYLYLFSYDVNFKEDGIKIF